MGRGMEDVDWTENENEQQLQQRKRPSHIRACCAHGCTSKGYRLIVGGDRVQYFGFPMHDKSLCARWAAALKVTSATSFEKSYVCSRHFRPGDYKMKISEDNKRTLRRSAIPSLEPVINSGKNRKSFVDNFDLSDEEESNLKEITTLVAKGSEDGDNFTVLLVKDTATSEADEAETAFPDTGKVIPESKKVPLKCEDILAWGPPFPWQDDEMGSWLINRLSSHEEQLQKTRQSADEEEETVKDLEAAVEQLQDVLINLILKKHMGRNNVYQHFRQLAT